MIQGNIESSSNVLGINSIVNKNVIDKNINLKEEEIDLLSTISSITNTKNKIFHNELYNKNIKDIANEVGVDLDNISNIFNDNDNESAIIDKKNNNDNISEINSNISKYSQQNEITKNFQNKPADELEKRNDYPSMQERFNNRAYNNNNKNEDIYNEQKRHDVFSNVLTNIKPNANYTHDIYTEEIKNKKSILLEQIQLLKLMLQEENEDVSNIPDLNEDDRIERLEHIYKILKIKKDRIQFNTLGEELIMFCVHMLESIFDGERTFFGKFQPDLRGWHNSVSVKLKRLRYETSTVVSDVVQSYNISYGTRLAIELIPSMFLYSKVKSACKNKYSKNNMSDNLSQIHI